MSGKFESSIVSYATNRRACETTAQNSKYREIAESASDSHVQYDFWVFEYERARLTCDDCSLSRQVWDFPQAEINFAYIVSNPSVECEAEKERYGDGQESNTNGNIAHHSCQGCAAAY
jgi:hypothetical protein